MKEGTVNETLIDYSVGELEDFYVGLFGRRVHEVNVVDENDCGVLGEIETDLGGLGESGV
jgi:hypothetical protein